MKRDQEWTSPYGDGNDPLPSKDNIYRKYNVGEWYGWMRQAGPPEGITLRTRVLVKGAHNGHDLELVAEQVVWENVAAFCVIEYAPDEKRVRCDRIVFFPHGAKREHGTCIERGGKVDWSTWEGE